MSRANVRVRPAEVSDIPALVDLLQSVDPTAGTFNGKPFDASTDHLETRLRKILTSSDRTFLIAADEAGAVAGLLAARRDEVGAIDLTPVLHITHLLVLPGSRRRGVGRSLLAAAVALAEQTGTDHVLATAAAGSREGNRYLARIGFSPVVVIRIASTAVLRRTLGMSDADGRLAVLRRARRARAQRPAFGAHVVGRGA